MIANYYIEAESADGNIPMLENIESYAYLSLEVKSINENKEIGSDYVELNLKELERDIEGTLSVPLDNLEINGSNVTLLCTLRAVVAIGREMQDEGNAIEMGNNSITGNITFIAEDRSVVAVEMQGVSNGNFSYHLNYAEENDPSIWKDIPNAPSDWQPQVIIAGKVKTEIKKIAQHPEMHGIWDLYPFKMLTEPLVM